MDVIVGVGHGTIAPGIGYPGHGGGMADACLVIHVVGAPHGGQLAEQVGLLVVVLGAAEPVHRIGAGLLANLQQLVADLADRLVPGDPLPLAVHQFGRILEASLAVTMLAHGGALGAVRPPVEWVIEGRFLAFPDTVAHLGEDAAAHRAMSADGLDLAYLALAGLAGLGCFGPAHHGRGQHAPQCGRGTQQRGTAQKIAAAGGADPPGSGGLDASINTIGYLLQFHDG